MSRAKQRLLDYLNHILEAIQRDLPMLAGQICKVAGRRSDCKMCNHHQI